MKYALFILIASLPLVRTALAGEVELKPRRHAEWAHGVRNDFFDLAELEESPGNATAPDGWTAWARLTLGEKRYLLCFAGIEDHRRDEPRLRVDRDGDGDLAEEEVIAGNYEPGHMPGARGPLVFEVNGLPGRFVIGDATLDWSLDVQITPMETVRLLTTWCGVPPAFGGGLGFSWAPGAEPVLCEPDSGRTHTRTIVGPCDVKPTGVSVRDGKVFARYETVESGGLVPVAVPAEVEAAFISYANQAGPHLPVFLCIPKDGFLHLPTGRHSVQARISGEAQGRKWTLLVHDPELTAEKGASFGPVEPLTWSLRIRNQEGGVEFFPRPRDASGRTSLIFLTGGLRTKEGPNLVVRNEEGEAVLAHRFEPESTWWKPYLWKPPAGSSGRTFTAALELFETPFRAEAPEATFEVP